MTIKLNQIFETFDNYNDLFCLFYRKFKSLTHFTFRGNELSPIKHLYLKNINRERSEIVDILEKIVDKVNKPKFSSLLFFILDLLMQMVDN